MYETIFIKIRNNKNKSQIGSHIIYILWACVGVSKCQMGCIKISLWDFRTNSEISTALFQRYIKLQRELHKY